GVHDADARHSTRRTQASPQLWAHRRLDARRSASYDSRAMRVVPLALRRDPLDVLASLAAEPRALLLELPDPERPLVLLGCAPQAELRVLADGRVERSDGRRAPLDPLAAIEAFVADGPVGASFPLGGA